jgi:hypothetical protein
MFKICPRVQNAALLCVALLVFSSIAGAVEITANTTLTLCDSFGKTWSVSAAACNPAIPLAVCLTGERDTLHLNGCGAPETMFGDYVLLLGVLSAYTVESSGCSSSFWVGHGTTDITGNVFNPAGLFGPFTLSQGLCTGANVAGSIKDPARR